MNYLFVFFRLMYESDALSHYDRICALMDKDFGTVEQFTVSL